MNQNLNAQSATESKDDAENIDYLHPDGKPTNTNTEPETIEEDVESKRKRAKEIEEADGHHMCKPGCQMDHKI